MSWIYMFTQIGNWETNHVQWLLSARLQKRVKLAPVLRPRDEESLSTGMQEEKIDSCGRINVAEGKGKRKGTEGKARKTRIRQYDWNW